MSIVHSSAKPTKTPDFWWLKGQRVCNPFLEYDLQARAQAQAAAASGPKDSEDEWLSDIKFGVQHINAIGEIIIKPQKYQLVLDMIHFKPEEISIKAVHNGFLVRAAHPEIVDGKEYITHHFYREYVLPHDIDPNEAHSWITTENILFIEAPKVAFDPDIEEEDTTVKEVQVVKKTE